MEMNYDEFAAAVAKHTDITADEFTELMKGCDVRTNGTDRRSI